MHSVAGLRLAIPTASSLRRGDELGELVSISTAASSSNGSASAEWRAEGIAIRAYIEFESL
jgi:hypothetical protein